jgi:Uma2 family endonuclease
MASKTLVPVGAYLRMSFDGIEPDYLDGELKERHLGSTPHFQAQERLLEFFRSLKQSHSLFAYPEVTLRISPTRYRVADVAVFRGQPKQKIPSEPTEFVIEIVSEDDRWVDIQEKLAEYNAWGIRHVWLIDPWTRKLHICGETGMHEVAAFEAPEFAVRLSAAEIFAE